MLLLAESAVGSGVGCEPVNRSSQFLDKPGADSWSCEKHCGNREAEADFATNWRSCLDVTSGELTVEAVLES